MTIQLDAALAAAAPSSSDAATSTAVTAAPPTDFHHPYTPYSIQLEFMTTVYATLESGRVGILESPTGTGKSLSLICGALTWLRDFKGKSLDEELAGKGDDGLEGEPDWVVEAARARRRRELLRGREELEARLKRAREREEAARRKMLAREKGDVKRRRVVQDEGGGEKSGKASERDDEDAFMLDEYDSDNGADGVRRDESALSNLPAETLAILEKLGLRGRGPRKGDDDEEMEDEIKIFYASRTHSQLSQFVNELRRVHMPPSYPPLEPPSQPKEGRDEPTEPFKHLTLGSRKNLCINPRVQRLGNITAINERCVELQQSSTPKDHRCSFLPNAEQQPLVNDFRDRVLGTIRDIEDLAELGKEISVCPYYAARSAIKPAEIVTLPYPLLLQKNAREALGVSLKGHVVIIDEAHNLMDAISGIYGVAVSLSQLRKSRAQMGMYLQKFKNRLKGKNRVYLAQMLRLVDSLIGYLDEKSRGAVAEGTVEPAELLRGKGVDQINLYKLLRYLQESKLARKVEGYVAHTEEEAAAAALDAQKHSKAGSQNEPRKRSEASTPALMTISSFLEALNNPSKEGKFFFARRADSASTPPDIELKYMLLDPSAHFRTIVDEARAVILAGGTMSPMSDYTSHLLSYLPKDKIQTLSCGHVIPKNNLLAWTLSKGPTGKNLEFTYQKRGGREGEEMMDELGLALLNICALVPDGVVVFVPSYAFLDTLLARWSLPLQPGLPPIKARLEAKKKLFTESREGGAADTLLEEYATAIDSTTTTTGGALLLSVVGGKLSEGINFSDRLARCVVLVGLPFPNSQSAEWTAKTAYIAEATVDRLSAADADGVESHGQTTAQIAQAGTRAAREYYENACMRAVNQSVGRAIRHRDDYAGIVLIDARFARESIQGKLPGWIREGLVERSHEKGFGELMRGLGGFFREKRARGL